MTTTPPVNARVIRSGRPRTVGTVLAIREAGRDCYGQPTPARAHVAWPHWTFGGSGIRRVWVPIKLLEVVT